MKDFFVCGLTGYCSVLLRFDHVPTIYGKFSCHNPGLTISLALFDKSITEH